MTKNEERTLVAAMAASLAAGRSGIDEAAALAIGESAWLLYDAVVHVQEDRHKAEEARRAKGRDEPRF
jgi:hypothetical protein